MFLLTKIGGIIGDRVDQYASNYPITTAIYEEHVIPERQTTELAYTSDRDHGGVVSSSYFYGPVEAYNLSDSSLKGELAATHNFIN